MSSRSSSSAPPTIVAGPETPLHTPQDREPKATPAAADEGAAVMPWYGELLVTVIATALGAGAACLSVPGWAGNDPADGHELPVPSYALVVVYAYAVNWIAFVPAFLCETERFYDLIGSFTYTSCTAFAVYLGPGRYHRQFPDRPVSWRTILLACMVVLWCLRLGFFLFRRVLVHEDKRFATIKKSFFAFLKTWTLQALWVTLTAGGAHVAITNAVEPEGRAHLWPLGAVGGLLWLIGWLTELVSDEQKWAFKQDSANRGLFIQHGLWAVSRHPNYVGEVTLWAGAALVAGPAMRGPGQIVLCALSPIFVFCLIRLGSGVPLLETSSDKRWGGQPDYEAYKRDTPVFWPLPKCCRAACGEDV